MSLSGEAPQGASRDPSYLGWPYRLAATLNALIVAVLWIFVQLCGLGENRSELYNHRCGSALYTQLPLLGFVVLGVGLAAAKRIEKRWPAWAGLGLALVPGVAAWGLLSV